MKAGKYVKKKPKKDPVRTVVLTGALLCALILGMLGLDRLFAQPEPTEPSTQPTEQTLPPNPYAPEDFSYDEKGYLRCTAGEHMLGIDVSEQQRQVDWQAVAEAGMEFAFVRIGYRGYTEGGVYPDAYALENLKAARAAGLKVGAYFYSQAVSVEEAQQEAAFCLNLLGNIKLDLPLVFDWEYVSAEARTGAMDKATLTEATQAFCEAVEQGGYEAMVYANWHLAQELLDRKQLQQYRFWLAMYDDVMDYPYQVDAWQYTQEGSVPGIEGAVDINLWLGS